jgi:gamma-glutamylcyclotransferase (GGCT)/AIG2-like uncharacterized protein YtfP
MSEYIFAYGNLRKGESEYHLLESINAEFVCECQVKGRIVEGKDWPNILIINKGSTVVSGELYLIRDTKILDTYKRRQIHPISIPTLSAWVWIL